MSAVAVEGTAVRLGPPGAVPPGDALTHMEEPVAYATRG